MFIFLDCLTTIVFMAFRTAGGAECWQKAHVDEQINLGGDSSFTERFPGQRPVFT